MWSNSMNRSCAFHARTRAYTPPNQNTGASFAAHTYNLIANTQHTNPVPFYSFAWWCFPRRLYVWMMGLKTCAHATRARSCRCVWDEVGAYEACKFHWAACAVVENRAKRKGSLANARGQNHPLENIYLHTPRSAHYIAAI